jgi:hypothetical protein
MYPLDRYGVQVRLISPDTLAHALHQALQLIIATQGLILGRSRHVCQYFGSDAEHLQSRLIRREICGALTGERLLEGLEPALGSALEEAM